jgi:hypothetical protein
MDSAGILRAHERRVNDHQADSGTQEHGATAHISLPGAKTCSVDVFNGTTIEY